MEQNEKMIIYQVFTRLFGNNEVNNVYNGSLQENGCGKMDDFTNKALHEIITDMMNDGLTHCAVITHGGVISNMLSCYGLPKYNPAELTADFGEGFDAIATAQMWLNSQAIEILGYCPYEKIQDADDFYSI